MNGAAYRWVCLGCQQINEAGRASCVACGFSASATGFDLRMSFQRARGRMGGGLASFLIAGILLLPGCGMPRSVLIHDGLNTTVVDAASRAPLADAFVFAHRDPQGLPIILARSDRNGRLELQPARRIQFVPLLGEAFAHLALTVCKDGYEAREVVTGGGWNADFKPGRVHEIEFLPLRPSFSPESVHCQVVPPAGE